MKNYNFTKGVSLFTPTQKTTQATKIFDIYFFNHYSNQNFKYIIHNQTN